MKYMRKTPVDAIQWTGHNREEIHEFIVYVAKYCCSKADKSGSLIIVYKDLRERTFKTVIPKYGWVVREGKIFQFYKDSTFRKTFEEVHEDGSKGIDWEGMNNTIKDAFDSFDDVFKGFNHVSMAEPSKETLDTIKTSEHINPDGRLTKFLDDLGEGIREKIEKQLSEGLNGMAGSDTNKATFESVLDEMKELHAKKDKDYSGSFHNLFKEYGMPYALCHIEEKLNRVKAIVANGGNAVKNEHIEDSLIDGACYNILTLIELRNRKH